MAIIDNYSTEIGDVIVIKAEVLNEGITELSSFVDITEDETGTRFFNKKFRYSIDVGITYSDFIDLTIPNIEGLDIDGSISNTIIFEYHYERAGTDPTGTVAFNSISLTGQLKTSAFGKLVAAWQRFYPTGTAFNTLLDSNRRQFQIALSQSENRLHSEAIGLLDIILPDNENFTEEAASRWEEFFGIPSGFGTDLEDRKAAILQKYRFPSTVKARGNAGIVQNELNLAGFDVYVHENRFLNTGTGDYFTKTFQEVVGIKGNAVHSPIIQHGTVQHGGSSENKVVNSIDPAVDATFDLQNNYERTFFVGGAILGNFATIPAAREVEFRKLLLAHKPAQTCAFILINYT